MFETFETLSPVLQALIGGLFTWGITALGASLVFIVRKPNKKLLDFMLGFAAGVMIAASFWSLLAPAIEMSADNSLPEWAPAAIGFFLGALLLRLVDKLLPHVHMGFSMKDAEGIKTSWHKTTLLVLAIVIHNIPEGLAVGVAFGAAAIGFGSATLAGAIALTIGIGLQNFPEGTAVAMPLRREGFSRKKSFMYGQLSGMVEPISAVLGASVIILFKPLLPYALAFAAGAMIFVVVEEVIPESQHGGNGDLATLGTITGFILMMILDVGLG
ncbi:MAG: ZIP family metal transporter [Candidatus Magasanikbacteria bacterium]|nr:ZIP family metal transporter [Candidatus Magasanikbacteria bacterium]